ncbi:flagellar motor switch protein FliM [Arthrobacter sp. N199823]|uniref:flagellar motor switch protein FliM n=1 Tax=Arthrobacter sp. N199823 TaxID=2058895 RepID=UPI000CE3BAFF|nr:flagellar motor switch protein FliM [Arthrobacter sp. N199823]
MPVLSPVSQLPASRANKVVEAYDFRRPTTLAREHSRVLELAFETFARQWGTQLTTKIRTGSAVVTEQVTMASYDEYAASLPASTAMVLFSLDGQESRGVIQFPSEAALFWVTRMLGGASTATIPDRKFTQIEHALVKRLMEDALEDLRYSFGSLLAQVPTVHGILFNSQFAQAAATDTLMIVAGFTVRVGEHSWHATIALPAEILVQQLGSNNPLSDAAAAPAQLRAQVGEVPVEVALALAPVPVTPNTILNLSVGDVLTLPHPTARPFDLTVGGKPIARAISVTHGSRKAGQIVTTEGTNS